MNRLLLTLIILISPLPARGGESEFAVDVMSVLSKSGCNAGTCHGNLSGKGGFKLSLRGQDPTFDFESITLASRGRRINLALPEQSLILQKASGAIAHRGGIRFDPHSDEYLVLLKWLRDGAHEPSYGSVSLTRLEVTPERAVVMAPKRDMQVHVTAHFSDGSSRDVTSRACYELSNLNASVDEGGRVTRDKFGETTLIVRYLHEQAPLPIAFTEERADFRWDEVASFNAVDTLVFDKLKRLRINPSPLCDDATFIRRAYLDLVGHAPTAEEAKRFIADEQPEKRSLLIDELLSRGAFADFWALKWADVLRAEEKVLDTKGVVAFHGWLRENIASAKPLDTFVRELVTGTGSTFEKPAANYYRANRDPSTRGETTARLFLGTRLQCAKCHNHPFDRWTQQDYYQWSSVFSQIDYKVGENKRSDKLDKNEFAGDQVVLIAKKKEVTNPTTGKIAAAKFLGGETLSRDAANDRLGSLGKWLTSPKNEQFAKTQANFIWYHVMGRGLVDPIDDFRLTNPPSNPPLLDLLAAELVESGFDIRAVLRKIMNSRTYQLASDTNPTNLHDETSYSRAYVKRLPAEVLLDMQSDFLDVPASFEGYESGRRAVQIPGVNSKKRRGMPVKSGDRFLKTFGKPERILACECERSNETTLKQAFMLIGEGLSERLATPGNRVHRLAASEKTDLEVVEALYWAALSRPPNRTEKSAALKLFTHSKTSRATAAEDLSWALMNAKEYLFRR